MATQGSLRAILTAKASKAAMVALQAAARPTAMHQPYEAVLEATLAAKKTKQMV